MDSYEIWFYKVAKIADVKYALEEDILEQYSIEMFNGFNNGFSPMRMVEAIAEDLFS